MSQAVLLKGVLATDSQMLERIRERDEYISFGKKLFISPDGRAAIAVVGSEWNSTELALVWSFVQPRLSAFYLSQGEKSDGYSPLEFSDDERGLLTGASAREAKVYRRFFLVTRDDAWTVRWCADNMASVEHLERDGYYAHGSEAVFANIYWKAGFDAVEIIKRICQNTSTCGGEIQTLKLKDLQPYPRSVEPKPARKPRQPRNPAK